MLKLSVLPLRLAVARLECHVPIPSWVTQGDFFAVTRTRDELSIVCADSNVPPGVSVARGWRALKVEGTLDSNQAGILASLAVPLAQEGIPIFALSTFETEYLLVRETNLEKAISTLESVCKIQV